MDRWLLVVRNTWAEVGGRGEGGFDVGKRGNVHGRCPSLCHFVSQGLLPTMAVLVSASPCPCVALGSVRIFD